MRLMVSAVREGEMRKIAVLLVFFSFVMFSAAFAAESAKPAFKVGDEVFACGCGTGCDCLMLSKKPGKCTCGMKLVKVGN